MAIAIACTKCEYRANVKDELAGKRAKCPRCATIIPIPASEPASNARHAGLTSAPSPGAAPMARAEQAIGKAPVVDRKELAAMLQSKLATPLPRRAFSPMYLLATLLTTLLMIMLPIIYVSLIGLVIALVRWHMFNNLALLQAAHGRAMFLAFGAYVAPLVIGLILILFMIKPLFARPPSSGQRRSLLAENEPVLFDFVGRICAMVGASPPRRIDIDCDINASAGFRRGWLSLLSGGDLVLTIGMPLVGGLSMRQFGGVLAHEFGHFTQGAGMRLTYIIRSINFWFLRVVYQRDSWDAWLEITADKIDFRIGWILYVAQLFVWLTRKVLWALMMIGHLVAGFMLRQMEYDADYYETQFGGSQSFEATTRQLAVLNLAYHGARSDLDRFFQVGRLADNLPKLIVSNAQQIPESVREKLNDAINDSKTDLFDSHPSDHQRIEAAHRSQAAGVFSVDVTASSIFTNFDVSSRRVTHDLYCELFGQEHIDSQKLNEVDELLRQREREQWASESRKRYFLNCFSPLRPIGLPTGVRGQLPGVDQLQKTLLDARGQMELLADAYRDALARFDKADTLILESMATAALLNAGVKSTPKNPLPFSSTKQCRLNIEQAEVQQARLSNVLKPFEAAAAQRLNAAMQLLGHKRIGDAIADGAAKRQAVVELLPLLTAIGTQMNVILDLRNYQTALTELCRPRKHRGPKDQLAGETRDCMRRVYERLQSVHALFTTHSFAFDNAKGKMPVAHYLLKYVPSPNDLAGIHDGARGLLDGLFDIYVRGMDRLCQLAEEVESSLTGTMSSNGMSQRDPSESRR